MNKLGCRGAGVQFLGFRLSVSSGRSPWSWGLGGVLVFRVISLRPVAGIFLFFLVPPAIACNLLKEDG